MSNQPDDVVVSGSSGTVFEPAPAGVHQAVLVDLIDLGPKSSKYGIRHMVRFVFQIVPEDGARRSNGKRFEVRQDFTKSLADRSKLKPFIENWMGEKLTKEETESFRLKTLVGKNALLQVVHTPRTNGDGVWANIVSAMPWPSRMGPDIVSENYERYVPKTDPNTPADQRVVNTHAGVSEPVTQTPDSDIPF